MLPPHPLWKGPYKVKLTTMRGEEWVEGFTNEAFALSLVESVLQLVRTNPQDFAEGTHTPNAEYLGYFPEEKNDDQPNP